MKCAPCEILNLRFANAEFHGRMSRRLGLDVCDEQTCHFCFTIMDRFGAHAKCCMGGGDRVHVHSETRNTLYKQAQAADTRLVLEAPGIIREGTRNTNTRRPVNVFLNSRASVKTNRIRPLPKVALNIRVICPQASTHLEAAAAQGAGAASSYTAEKGSTTT
jgi:hypothetical protein